MTLNDLVCAQEAIIAAIAKIESAERWAVVDSRGVPIPEVTAFLRHSEAIERSVNTLKAYASDLAIFYSFLEIDGVMWTAINNEVLGRFVKFARAASAERARPGNPSGVRTPASVNRCMASISAFALYRFESSNDQVYSLLRRTARKHKRLVMDRESIAVTIGPRLRQTSGKLQILTNDEVDAIVDSCNNLRDKLLVSMLYETGMRIGQLLLLRHSDIRVPKSVVRVKRHDLTLGIESRNKSLLEAEVPVPHGLIKLYAAYMGTEYGMVDSDFVFINLWSGKIGAPLSYKTVEQIVKRLRSKSGLDEWSAHTFRHSYVTRLLQAGVPIKTVSYLVTHASVKTTMEIYDHTNVEDIRRQLIEAGVFSDA
ncbi:tyrosine-type recombinase/integrase [Frigoribacterium sp. UYMn621]|uniref:tyrosine-type recombinase/integrase n=1 Tax=Frigoribacterium sp. UYMn621 TaxID=3156343 RepID=UPI003392EF4B